MIEQNNLQELKNALSIKNEKAGLKHTINRKSTFLPFLTRGTERPKFRKGFEGVLGGFTRYISHNELREELDLERLINNVSNLVDVKPEDQSYFHEILRMFLQQKNGKIKVFHPHIFQYLPYSSGPEMKGEQEIAKFLADILTDNDSEFKSLFKNHSSDDLVAKLILNELQGLENIERKKKYISKLPFLSEIFKKDFLFLVKHEDYFKDHYELLLSYYYFTYITQLTLKLAQQSKATYYNSNEVYYTLDWEATSKNRKGYGYGYHMIKDTARNLLIHINTLEHLNTLMGTKNSQSYSELLDTYEAMPQEQKELFLKLLEQWITEYRLHSLLPEEDKTFSSTYQSLTDNLFSSIEEAYQKPSMQGPRNRYSLSIEEVGKKYFLKTRGSLGYMLNVSQDLFLLLTALCLKNERKSLKQVFFELEKRGMYFDRYSKEEVVKLLDKLNLLDKKSDSGDAQYVKPIL
ncbi:DNA phosphorothioation-dependent restriction protein DptG [Priestia aryabhattai]|uniref:DNA phosphorothioation-dependent restriction protein DptG n=1 Tax=Priestia aryabhattai TaxID=412384 RepID=UPI001C8D1581|nr:DNA phosphorothioation-dependent restriction protein DptG [Priestia aryabhattai]MBY0078483.1 DNA phosphorothioation-dependent restriction protein DptG [Priestia aryabhattai]MCQ9283582.1 DNA phosphorothioation-dependent restriction protein DptG [Priestia aryabhattai]